MMRPVAVLLALVGTSWASSWSSFEPAFPSNPCHDGWAACVVNGEAVNAEMRAKGSVPQPADLRVDWFDLKATSSFSPFEGLSEYTGSAPEVAAADAEPEPEGIDEPEDDGVAEVDLAPSQESVEAERAADEAAMEEAAAVAAEEEARRQAEEAEAARREAQAAAARAAAEEEARRREAEELAAQAAQAEAAEQAFDEEEAEDNWEKAAAGMK